MMDEKTIIAIGVVFTLSLAITFSFMLLLQRNNAMKNIINYKCYMLTWLAFIPVIISAVMLNRKYAEIIEGTLYIVFEIISVIILTVFYFVLLALYDTKSIPKLYNEELKYTGAPKVYIFITALVCALSVTVLVGWGILLVMIE